MPGHGAAVRETIQREATGQASRDLTALVRQIQVILPHINEDVACEGLVQCDEDVERAIEYLLTRPTPAKKTKEKKKKEAEPTQDALAAASQEEAGPEVAAATNGKAEEAVEKEEQREKTTAERELHKLRKKLREIERIEERLSNGENVDPLQKAKIDKKHELEGPIMALEETVQQEENEREAAKEREREAARRAAEEEARRQREERERELRERREKERQEREEQLRQRQQQQMRQRQEQKPPQQQPQYPPQPQQPPQQQFSPQQYQQQRSNFMSSPPAHAPAPISAAPTAPPAQTRQQPMATQNNAGGKGGELLAMLHSNKSAAHDGYNQTRSIAQQLSGGAPARQFAGGGGGPAEQPQQTYAPPIRGTHKMPNWNGEGDEAPEKDESFMDTYSTPLDMTDISEEKRKRAAQLAAEIEREQGYSRGGGDKGGYSKGERGGKGYGDKGGDKGSKGKGKGKRDRDDWKGGDKGGWKGRDGKDGKDDRKGGGKGKREDRGKGSSWQDKEGKDGRDSKGRGKDGSKGASKSKGGGFDRDRGGLPPAPASELTAWN
eukprot:TRINITY_DN17475_c0_g3_i1.p1 TRINITY_DN17475_c0_g3~~TRINITY_DN17475_c0_g3_i1.p1  ORF type:complete len:552 (-),score=200.84 TRINITY_DN17475_c0_g3_i1:181-1836(-)